jgi:hypothetical protein
LFVLLGGHQLAAELVRRITALSANQEWRATGGSFVAQVVRGLDGPLPPPACSRIVRGILELSRVLRAPVPGGGGGSGGSDNGGGGDDGLDDDGLDEADLTQAQQLLRNARKSEKEGRAVSAPHSPPRTGDGAGGGGAEAAVQFSEAELVLRGTELNAEFGHPDVCTDGAMDGAGGQEALIEQLAHQMAAPGAGADPELHPALRGRFL